jgi:hypothetical protein
MKLTRGNITQEGRVVFTALIIALFFMLATAARAYQPGERVWTPPITGNFYSMANTNMPPQPFFPPGLDVYYRGNIDGNESYWFDDTELTSGAFTSDAPGLPGDPGDSGPYDPPEAALAYNYSTNDLWIEILSVTNEISSLLLHNTKSNLYCQLLTNLDLNITKWGLGQIVQATNTTTFFNPEPTWGRPISFYRGVEGYPIVSISRQLDAIEPSGGDPGQAGQFQFQISDTRSTNFIIYYAVTGSASNGIDYTNISGNVTMPANADSVTLFIDPIADTNLEFEESVKLTLILTNGYVIDPSNYSATIWINDNFGSNLFTIVTNGSAIMREPVGLDYSPTAHALLLSYNSMSAGEPWDFEAFYTNGVTTNLVVTNWSGIHGIGVEIKVATVKTTANGFTAGDMYFGTAINGIIAKLSADGTVSNMNWAVLNTNVDSTDSLIRGGLYIDETGSFGGDLIVVTGGEETEGGGVWRINSSGTPTLLANITNTHLEGVVTLTNDVTQWGPWAGKIITGAEARTNDIGDLQPLIYAISTNGSVESFDLGISPEDFDLIRSNQDLYIVDQSEPQLVKLSSSLLSGYHDALLITQEGAFVPDQQAKLFIVQWDNTGLKFVIRRISYYQGGWFEHVTFAPINLQSHAP